MIKAIKTTLATLAATMRVVAGAGAYAIYPAAAFAIVMTLAFIALIPMLGALATGGVTFAHYAALVGGIYLAYVIFYVVTAFSTVAFLVGASAKLDGIVPALARGRRRALERSVLVLAFVAKAASLDLLAFLARTFVGPIFGMVIAPTAAKAAWSRWQGHAYDVPMSVEIASIALQPLPPRDAYRHAEELIARTWGRSVTPSRNVGLLGLFVLLPIIAFIALPNVQQGIAAGDSARLGLGLSIMLLAIGSFTTLSLLANAVLGMAAWRYAVLGSTDVVPGDPDYGRHAFTHPKSSSKAAGAAASNAGDDPAKATSAGGG
jgi:hypothetical protein